MDDSLKQAVEQIVEVEIKAAISNVLARNPQALVNAIVEGSFGPGDRKNAFELVVNQMIRAAAMEEVQAHIETIRPLLREKLAEKLKKSPEAFAERIAEKMVAEMGEAFNVTVKVPCVDWDD